MDDQIGGGTLLPLIGAQLRYVLGLLDQRRYPDTVGRRLHGTAAELMRQAGWSAFESGHHPVAQRYWVAGLHAAHAAGDRALGAHIIGFMATRAVEALTGGVDSARVAGYLTPFLGASRAQPRPSRRP